jgi:hypothetical protein
MFIDAESLVSNHLHCHSRHLAVFDAFALPISAVATFRMPRLEKYVSGQSLNIEL